MNDHGQDGRWETDDIGDFSVMNRRLNSFNGSSLANQVPAERLARAGFYFTGQADRVRCFSCQKTVENWCRGDTPVERHKEVSPTCTFLNCIHGPNFNSSHSSPLTNGTAYDEAAEDMEYRLRTGEVVDESSYPMSPHMKSERARLQTFASWPPTAPVRPQQLAEAGLYYLGEEDRVECFCCAGKLNGWEAGDTAWGEHTNHFPNCFFILGHDVGNIPLQVGTAEEEGSSRRRENNHVLMESFEERLGSFASSQHPIDHERLARAGFYSTGPGDKVLCFRCGGGLKGWQPEEDPWEEHAKHYPGCSFLLAEKGQEFVNSIQLQDPRRNRTTQSHQNGFSGDNNEVLSSTLAQRAIAMGLEPSLVEKTILEKTRTGVGYSSLGELVEDYLGAQEDNSATSQKKDEDPLEKLRKLQREKQCKICMDRDMCIVLMPCCHLVTCEKCSESLTKCPICCGAITQKIKTYIA